GFMPFYPGPGLGGHCIPIDPHYLAWKLRSLNYTARFIELASEVNGSMPQFVVDRIAKSLNDDRKPVNGRRILVIGVAYKPNVNDVRESPAVDIISLLHELGADASYHDPFIPELREGSHELKSIPLDKDMLKKTDCVVIVTNHANIDYDLILEHAKLVIDTRNALGNKTGNARIVKL
ncbi:MAG: UDP-N-acetyl-D-glucosamine dehydrogenase, partial [Candidatus Sumerlaeota bacterium]|nr:UDP-N-acetyl-D-glucosamine dehydrogenase [Candidatus Sumerlaeota bacterium]